MEYVRSSIKKYTSLVIMNIRDPLVDVAKGPYQIAQVRCSGA